MGNFLQRLLQFAENEGITITHIEREIGASKGVLTRALSKSTDIQSKWVTSIVETYHQISPDWLISGRGNMYREEYYPRYDQETKKRVALFCASNGLNYEDFSERTGLTMSGILEAYPNLNPVWLLHGEGNVFINDLSNKYYAVGSGDKMDEKQGSYTNYGSGNKAFNGSTINVGGTGNEIEYMRKRIDELEKLVEQKDRMIDILTQK